jgi:hypothetical protein
MVDPLSAAVARPLHALGELLEVLAGGIDVLDALRL